MSLLRAMLSGLLVFVAVETAVAAPREGFDTPDDVWNASQKALRTKDWGGLYDCVTPEAREKGLFGAFAGLLFAIERHDLRNRPESEIQKLVQECDALRTSHGISDAHLHDLEATDGKNEEEITRMFLRPIRDKRRCYVQSMNLNAKLDVILQKYLGKPSDSAPDASERAPLENVIITDDAATGEVIMVTREKER